MGNRTDPNFQQGLGLAQIWLTLVADRLHLIVLKESMEILAAVIIFYDKSYLWALTHAIIQVHLL